MTPETRRRIVTSVVLLIASIVLVIGFLRPQSAEEPTNGTDATTTIASSSESAETPAPEAKTTEPTAPATEPVAPSPESTAPSDPAPAAEAVTPETETKTAGDTSDANASDAATPKWKARASQGPIEGQPTDLGSLDPATDRYRIRFSQGSAGIDSIVFSDFWTEARQKRAAAAHLANPSANPLPPEEDRYALRQSALGNNAIPLLSAAGVNINGTFVSLFGNVWSQTGPGAFETEIVDQASGDVGFKISRRFLLAKNGYDLSLEQRIENLGSTDADVQWVQYGPGDLDRDRGSFIEVRRFHFGYLMPPSRDPGTGQRRRQRPALRTPGHSGSGRRPTGSRSAGHRSRNLRAGDERIRPLAQRDQPRTGSHPQLVRNHQPILHALRPCTLLRR